MKVEQSPGEELVTGGTGTWDRSQDWGRYRRHCCFCKTHQVDKKGESRTSFRLQKK